MTLKRLLILLVSIGFVVFNPIHLGWTLPYIAELDTPLAELLQGNEQNVLIFSTVYFTAVMMPVYYWIWTRRRKRSTKNQNIENAVAGAYIGPGGGKKRPKNKRNSNRRKR